MTTMFSQTGGARIGFFNASWPFAKLSATSDIIRLTCLGRECEFPRREVRRLSRHRALFSTGLRIEHAVAACPEFVVFWTFGFEKLKRGLEGAGYEVQEASIGQSRHDVDALIAALLSFVPKIGILFGIVAVVWALRSRTERGKDVLAVSAAGIAFNVLFFWLL
jgi:hypothetical protein